jgi:uncharacterized protein
MLAIVIFLLFLYYMYVPSCSCRSPVVGSSRVAGLGVFARKNYSVGDRIDTCPTVAVPWETVRGKSQLEDYVFESASNSKSRGGVEDVLVPLANCGLYNHSEANNAYYQVRPNDTIAIFALLPITRGTEITVNYGQGYWKSRGIVPK